MFQSRPPRNVRANITKRQARFVALRAPNLEEVKSSEKLSAVPFAGTALQVPSNSPSLPKEPERSPNNDTSQAIYAFRESCLERTQLACLMLPGWTLWNRIIF